MKACEAGNGFSCVRLKPTPLPPPLTPLPLFPSFPSSEFSRSSSHAKGGQLQAWSNASLTVSTTVEGLFTICVSILLFFVLPGSPDEPRPLLSAGLIRFTERDQQILKRRLEVDDEYRKGGAQGMHIPLKLVWRTVSHWRRWPTYVATFSVFSTWASLTTYTPSIIM